MSQLFLYDRVVVRDVVVDEDTGESLAGIRGLISAIGYRDEKYPFTVDVQDGDAYKQYFFGEDEIELED